MGYQLRFRPIHAVLILPNIGVFFCIFFQFQGTFDDLLLSLSEEVKTRDASVERKEFADSEDVLGLVSVQPRLWNLEALEAKQGRKRWLKSLKQGTSEAENGHSNVDFVTNLCRRILESTTRWKAKTKKIYTCATFARRLSPQSRLSSAIFWFTLMNARTYAKLVGKASSGMIT